MRHLQLKDLWIKNEIALGNIEIRKVLGLVNSADLMTKVLHVREILAHLNRLSIHVETTSSLPSCALVQKNDPDQNKHASMDISALSLCSVVLCGDSTVSTPRTTGSFMSSIGSFSMVGEPTAVRQTKVEPKGE